MNIVRMSLIILCSFVVNSALAETTASQSPLDHIVAVVDDDTITQTQLQQQLQNIKKQFAAMHQPLPDDEQLNHDILQQLINTSLQLKIAERLGLIIPDEALDRAIEDIALRNKTTVAELKQQLRTQHIDYQRFRADTRKQLLLQAVQQKEVMGKIKFDQHQLDNIIDDLRKQQQANIDYRLQHVFVPIDENADPQQKQSALQQTKHIRQQMLSTDTEPKTAQGVVFEKHDWQKGDAIPTLFSQALTQLQPGEISPPLAAANGYHLVKLVQKRQDSKAHTITKYHARHLLLKVGRNTPSDLVLAEIKQLRQRLVKGEKFATLAANYSQDPQSASKGGDLGWIEPGTIAPSLEQALTKLTEKTISEPIRSNFGWHLVEKLGQKSSDNQAQWEEKQARDILFQQKFNQALQLWLQELRSHAYIKVMPEYQ